MTIECLTSDSSDSDVAQRVYRLRQLIYVEEMGYPPATVRDKFDTHSRLLLLRAEGQDIGTARVTDGDAGSLELECQGPLWAEMVAANRRRSESVCELTRLMLIPKVRGGPALALLFLEAVKTIDWARRHRMYGAGRMGGLSRLYQGLGFPLCLAEPVDYCIGSFLLGQYQLLCLDRPRVSSMQQALYRKIGSVSRTN